MEMFSLMLNITLQKLISKDYLFCGSDKNPIQNNNIFLAEIVGDFSKSLCNKQVNVQRVGPYCKITPSIVAAH